MAETTTVSDPIPDSSPNNKDHEFKTDNSDQNVDPTSISNDTSQSPITSIPTETNYSVPNPSSDNMNYGMSRLSIHDNYYQPDFNTSYYNQAFYPGMHQAETQAQLVAFTQPLMSIRLSYEDDQRRLRKNYRSSRPYTPRQQTSILSKTKPETKTPELKFYVDNFPSNFADKPTSSDINGNNKTKPKHVTFQEPDTESNSSKVDSDYSNAFPTSSLSPNAPPYQSSHWRPSVPTYSYAVPSYDYTLYPNDYYSHNEFYSPHPQMMIDPRLMPRSRGMNMMSRLPAWSTLSSHYDNRRMPYAQSSYRSRQLYDPNQPKASSITESHPSSQILRPIVPKNKKKTKQTNSDDSSTVSTPEPIAHPITILRKPIVDSETIPSKEEEEAIPVTNEQSTTVETTSAAVSSSDIPSESDSTLSFPSHELLSILQSANCISSLNEYAQQKKFLLNFEYSYPSSTTFICSISINDRHFPPSSSCATKTEAQKLACDQVVRILYRESCSSEGSSPEFSSKHDYIAHRSISTFQNLNVNELLLGRKTLACMLMITDEQYSQAEVVSIGTGNSCLDETNLSYADDGTALHDCHAEILARRGLIKYLFHQIKQCQDDHSSIFISDSTSNKYQLRENITFHLYISSLPCGNASLNISSNALRYKQGAIEGTSSTPTNSPIKSCSDKIYRWNILGIQGGLLINLLIEPIYLQSITIACETTFDRDRVNSSLSEHSKEHFHSLPSPYRVHHPDIDCPTMKSFQNERQVAKLQSNAFAWNITENERRELLEPMTGRLKNNRSMSSLSKQNFLRDFLEIFPGEKSVSYQRAKQFDEKYLLVKNLISMALKNRSSEGDSSWISKSDRLEQFQIE